MENIKIPISPRQFGMLKDAEAEIKAAEQKQQTIVNTILAGQDDVNNLDRWGVEVTPEALVLHAPPELVK